MTYVIDKLEQKGVLSQNAFTVDRSKIHVRLTDDGNELMNEIMPKYHELVDNMFDSLNSDEAETLVNLLKKVRNKVKNAFWYLEFKIKYFRRILI
ncbi:MarR family winged helix-turn-helix transcriptional regulator [Peribacillus huizhouensis]|uniref:DNA-binding MarR family transcriptional regulator n=1 Tax=Peribacillus huizhouensis TaxID=1501239 RepID=A0ABR6CTF4_9BACI|nr:hypothetical protein [Peribacillus huizhouensis]MBA9028307.1 DNA-binding MarR family transcriptional regulator [Peribacillus huizhouensis]